jgi:uncharacterized BrkB/YihY/UPF0761 family membrane protein
VGTDKKERQDRDQEKPGHIGESARGIGGVMVALLWLYFSGLAILLGAQLNATIDRASQPVGPAALKVV